MHENNPLKDIITPAELITLYFIRLLTFDRLVLHQLLLLFVILDRSRRVVDHLYLFLLAGREILVHDLLVHLDAPSFIGSASLD